ncbi:hypothetical protein CEP54_003094 [Fusarium duplospermum]|uniref:Uncharacterized protein n=1 Tax=Fusarium duplospermum TaxID=1325734 RepID=A0A428QR61_9HYPO|nr:hypothetical protein CEP54_003094 [Fusarium duplospermum]
MPLAHATPLWKRSAPGVSLASVHWNLTASAGQLPCPWRGAPNKPHLLLAGVLPSRFWGVALPLSLRNASTSLRLPSTLTLPRDATDKLQTSPQALSLTNLPLIFSLYVLRCDPCRASAPPRLTSSRHSLDYSAAPGEIPGSPAKHPIHTAQPIIPGLAAAGRLGPAVRFLFNVLVRPKPSRPFTSPSSPPSKFKSLVDR